MEDKKEIRRIVRQRIKEMTSETRESAATKIFREIESSDEFLHSHCIALFAAMNDEVATATAIKAWRDMGKHVVVPRVEGDIMRFYDYDPEHMSIGAFGIEEPTSTIEILPDAIDLIIVPARAFTRHGVRLGRGGGFYDKYMSQATFRAYKIGIAYECQIFDSLPYAPHDIAVDRVVTEK
jgi:5-formyltetrahydrofolate cyclo-ligase